MLRKREWKKNRTWWWVGIKYLAYNDPRKKFPDSSKSPPPPPPPQKLNGRPLIRVSRKNPIPADNFKYSTKHNPKIILASWNPKYEQCVRVGTSMSSWKKTNGGLPQGRKLGPLQPCEICRSSVILYYAWEIDSPIGCWGINFPFVTQNDWKLQISQGYIIRVLQHFPTKLRNITNFVMLFQAVMYILL
jgi:hypothetical protein